MEKRPEPAFNASIIPPTASSVTAPAGEASVPRSSNLVVRWDNAGLVADTVIITIDNLVTGKTFAKTGVSNTGSTTVSTGDLMPLGAGTATVTVTKYRYHIATAGTRKYVVLAESSSFSYMTVQ